MRLIAALLVLPALACGAPPPADLPPTADVPRFACRETTFQPNDEVSGVWRYALDEATRERVGLHAPGVGPGVDMEQRERFDGAWRAQRRSLDFGADGRVDHVEETTYDAGGRPILATVAYDDSGIAAWSTTFTYDDGGHLVRMEETSRAGDRVVRAFTNDDRGRAVTIETDWDGDGVVDDVRRDAWTYDVAGRPTQLAFGLDDDGAAIETTTWTYDDAGRATSVATDSALDGELLATFVYAGDVLVETTTGYALDGSAPGDRTTYEYACE